jgi:hypothetical protein
LNLGTGTPDLPDLPEDINIHNIHNINEHGSIKLINSEKEICKIPTSNIAIPTCNIAYPYQKDDSGFDCIEKLKSCVKDFTDQYFESQLYIDDVDDCLGTGEDRGCKISAEEVEKALQESHYRMNAKTLA